LSGQGPPSFDLIADDGFIYYVVTQGGVVRLLPTKSPAELACGVARLGALLADPASYPENAIFRQYFEQRLNRVAQRDGIRT
jgi:hypothetical protein